jgi:hypothetical protein
VFPRQFCIGKRTSAQQQRVLQRHRHHRRIPERPDFVCPADDERHLHWKHNGLRLNEPNNEHGIGHHDHEHFEHELAISIGYR